MYAQDMENVLSLLVTGQNILTPAKYLFFFHVANRQIQIWY